MFTALDSHSAAASVAGGTGGLRSGGGGAS